MTKVIGFTGTQRGMTDVQFGVVANILFLLKEKSFELHHGDCIGADAEVHELARLAKIQVVLHPPTNGTKRAFCKDAREEWPAEDYLARDRAIVNAADVLLAAPGGFEEEVRSGTWYTVRKARQKGSIPIVVVYPDGRIEAEKVKP